MFPIKSASRTKSSTRPAKSRRHLAYGLMVGSLAFSASAQDDTPLVISPELFNALESWSEASATLESVALDSNAEAIYLYTDSVSDAYRGMSVDEHFQKTYPEAHAAYLDALEVDKVDDSADFVAFIMATQDATYAKWQQERGLRGLRFESFVNENFPDITEEVERQNVSAAQQGITMSEHVDQLGSRQLSMELDQLLDAVSAPAGTTCQCWTVATFPHLPDPWQAEALENYEHSWGWPVKKREKLWFSKAGRGAGKDFNFHRHSRHTDYQVTRNRTNYDSQMRVRMHCTENGTPGGTNCSGSTCVGELAMKTTYRSRVFEKVDVGGLWSNQSKMLTSDAAALTFDPPGPAPEQILFQKGVALAGNVKTGWDAQNALTLLQTVAQTAQTIFFPDPQNAQNTVAAITSQLNNENLDAIIGLIKREGNEGSDELDMQVTFDTAGSAPFLLLPNTTLAFDLDTASEFYSRGLGGFSDSKGEIDSSHFMVGVARNYQCAPTVGAPSPQSFWLWSGGPDAPESGTTLANEVRNWITVELGATPSGTTSQVGQYP